MIKGLLIVNAFLKTEVVRDTYDALLAGSKRAGIDMALSANSDFFVDMVQAAKSPNPEICPICSASAPQIKPQSWADTVLCFNQSPLIIYFSCTGDLHHISGIIARRAQKPRTGATVNIGHASLCQCIICRKAKSVHI